MGRLNWSKAAQDRRLREQGSEPLAVEDQTLRRGWLPSKEAASEVKPSSSAPAVHSLPKPPAVSGQPNQAPILNITPLPAAPTKVAVQKAKGSNEGRRIDKGFMVSRTDGSVIEIESIRPPSKRRKSRKLSASKKWKSGMRR